VLAAARAHAPAADAPRARAVPRARSKADATTPDADGRSAVELALARDATALLALLTDARTAAARMRDVRALMQRTQREQWARNGRMTACRCALRAAGAQLTRAAAAAHSCPGLPPAQPRLRSWLGAALTGCLWAALLAAIFVSLYPQRAEARACLRAHAASPPHAAFLTRAARRAAAAGGPARVGGAAGGAGAVRCGAEAL
jgi:hypothetical protein